MYLQYQITGRHDFDRGLYGTTWPENMYKWSVRMVRYINPALTMISLGMPHFSVVTFWDLDYIDLSFGTLWHFWLYWAFPCQTFSVRGLAKRLRTFQLFWLYSVFIKLRYFFVNLLTCSYYDQCRTFYKVNNHEAFVNKWHFIFLDWRALDMLKFTCFMSSTWASYNHLAYLGHS